VLLGLNLGDWQTKALESFPEFKEEIERNQSGPSAFGTTYLDRFLSLLLL
jgi:hypothetical protein